MRALAGTVYDNHVKKDPKSEQKGMIYEEVDWSKRGQVPGQWVVAEYGDAMHDGAWFTAALCNAYRATGDKFYLDFLNEYPLPFYTKMINHSDTLFTNGVKEAFEKGAVGRWVHRDEFKLLQAGKLDRPPRPRRGWVPYWWDDGAGLVRDYDWSIAQRNAKERKPAAAWFPRIGPCYNGLLGAEGKERILDGYSLDTSNHMAQDLAVMLMELWWLTGDDRVKEACLNYQDAEFDSNTPGPLGICALAGWLAGSTKHEKVVVGIRQATASAYTGPWMNFGSRKYATRGYTDFYAAPVAGYSGAWPVFADNEEYAYYTWLASHGGMPAPLARRLMDEGMGIALYTRLYFDDVPEQPGWSSVESWVPRCENGHNGAYHSRSNAPTGSRFGTQHLVIKAMALHALREYPGLWEAHRREQCGQDYWVRMLDDDPVKVDGQRDEAYGPETLSAAALTASLASDLRRLYVWGMAQGKEVVFRIYFRPGGQEKFTGMAWNKGWKDDQEMVNPYAEFKVKADGAVEAMNHKGERLTGIQAAAQADRGGFRFELRIPYTMSAPDQVLWANGVENARLSLRCGQSCRDLYIQSSEQRATAFLERYLSQAFTYWRGVFDKNGGFIPVHFKYQAGHSESGGPAHLLKALSAYVMYLERKCWWEEQRKPGVR